MGLLGDIGKAFSGALPNILTGGVSSLVSSLAGSALGGLNAQTSNHYTRELMRYQTDLQHAENKYWADYNSPLQQMDRLKAAGLNPNLVYGNGATATMEGSVSPTAHSDYRPASIDAIGAANMLAQNQNLQKQNDVLTNEARKKAAEAEGQELYNQRLRGQNPFQYGSYEAMEQHYKALNAKTTNEKLASEIALNRLYAFGEEIKNRFENAASYIKLDQMSTDLAIAEINKSYLPRLLENQLNLGLADIAKTYQTITELAAMTSMYNQLAKKASQETLTEAEKTDLTKADKEIRQRKAELSKLGLNPDDNSMLGGILNAIIGIYQHRANW